MKRCRPPAETGLIPTQAEVNLPGIHTGYLVLAIVALGLGVNVNGGAIAVLAMACLTITILAAILALVRKQDAIPTKAEYRMEWAVFFGGAVFQFFLVIGYPFGSVMHINPPPSPYLVLTSILIMGLLLAGMLWKREHAISTGSFLLLVIIQLLLGILLIKIFPKPGIDVLRFQEGALSALMDGMNPYAIRFPDLYLPELSARFYAPGLSIKGVLQFGYPYLPLTLFLSLPGSLLGDVRYASLMAMVLAGLLIAYARPGRLSKLAAVFLIFTPIFPRMLYCAWTESYVILMLALVWFCHNRSRRFLPYAVGLLLVSKQYMVLIVPLTILLFPRPWNWREIAIFAGKAVLTGMVVTLPLALWNIHEFLKSAVFLQVYQPFRWDAMSFLVLARPHNPSNWVWLPFALVFSAIPGLLWVARRRNVSFPFAMGITMLLFFAFSKQAFANYYYLVTGAFCCALANENMDTVPRSSTDSSSEQMRNCYDNAATGENGGVIEK